MATLTINLDDSLKDDFTLFCRETGLNASVAVSMFARTVVREQRIPFEITTQNAREQENRLNEAAWRGYEDMLAGRGRDADDVLKELEQRQGWA